MSPSELAPDAGAVLAQRASTAHRLPDDPADILPIFDVATEAVAVPHADAFVGGRVSLDEVAGDLATPVVIAIPGGE